MNTLRDCITIHLEFDRCVGSRNTLNDLSKGACIPIKT